MKITKRERGILIITVTVVALVINYLVVIPLVRSRTDTIARLKTEQGTLRVMQETIKRIPDWQKQYDELKHGLGQKTEPFQVGSDVEKKIVEVATSSGVQLTSRRSMTVEDKGAYRVFPVQCGVEATTDSLVHFLFALQTGAGFMSVEQLQVAPKPENPNILRCDILVHALTTKMGSRGS